MRCTAAVKQQMREPRGAWLPVVVVICMFSFAVAAEPAYQVDPEVTAAVLTEDWDRAAELLGDVDTLTASPVLRLLKGHTCLALNENNMSICLFLDVHTGDSSEVVENLTSWRAWAGSFVAQNPSSPIAHYFAGDAKARQHKWDEAMGFFNRGLELKPGDALLLSARGAAYANQGKTAAARVDFDAATRGSPPLADAYANIGALRMQQKNGASGAMAAFTSALDLSPEFALALYGRGCVSLVLDSIDKAKRDMDAAASKTLCAAGRALLDANKLRVVAHVYGLKPEEVASALADTSRDAGTVFDAKVGRVDDLFDNYLGRQTQGNFNALAGVFGRLPKFEQEKFFNERMKPVMASMPDFQKHNDEVRSWNKPGGVASWVADILKLGPLGSPFVPPPGRSPWLQVASRAGRCRVGAANSSRHPMCSMT